MFVYSPKDKFAEVLKKVKREWRGNERRLRKAATLHVTVHSLVYLFEQTCVSGQASRSSYVLRI
jgi:hypothetical protein